MSTIIAEPTAKCNAIERQTRPSGLHLRRFTRIARRFGAGFEPTSHPEHAEGTLTRADEWCWAVLSYDPASTKVRLFVRVAYTKGYDDELESALSTLEASARHAHFEQELEAGPQLTLEASMDCPRDPEAAETAVSDLFREVIQLLWDPRLHQALIAAGACSCIHRADPWNDIPTTNERKDHER